MVDVKANELQSIAGGCYDGGELDLFGVIVHVQIGKCPI